MNFINLVNKDSSTSLLSLLIQRPIVAYLSLVVLGAVSVLSYAPWQLWPVKLLTLSALLIFTYQAKDNKTAAKYGFYYGLGWFGFGISWVHVAIADFGGLPLVLSLLLMLLLVAYLALFTALSSYFSKRYSSTFGLLGFTVFFFLFEQLRGVFLTGFPWLAIGYSQQSGPLASFTPVIGEIGLQLICLLIVTALASLFKKEYKKHALTSVIGITALSLTLNQLTWVTTTDNKVKLALVQGNIEQSIKWQPENEWPTMKKYLDMSEPHWQNSDIVIWPEAAIPQLEWVAQDYLHHLDEIAAEHDSSLITGIVDYNPDTLLAFNNVVSIGKVSDSKLTSYRYHHSNRYAKHHLLPIGEFVPFQSVLKHIAPLFNLPMSSFNRGNWQQDNLTANGINLAPAICFEIAFADQLRANLYQDSDIILTVSNDAWFGNSHGPWQHLQIAQMRALEFGKPVVRATNNGVTAIIDHSGNIQSQLPQNQALVLTDIVTLTQGKTPYLIFGNILAYLLLVLTAICAYLLNRRTTATN